MKAWNGLAFARAEYESCRAQAAHDRALMSSALFRRLSNGFNISIPRFRSPYLAASSMALERPAKRTSASLAAALASIRSEEHTSELQSLMRTSYAVFCLKKKKHT